MYLLQLLVNVLLCELGASPWRHGEQGSLLAAPGAQLQILQEDRKFGYVSKTKIPTGVSRGSESTQRWKHQPLQDGEKKVMLKFK